MSIATVGSYLIHYEVLGRGRPLIFIHGWLGSWRYWWPSMQALSARHRSFAFDLWGFGDSSKSEEMYSLSAYTDMIDQFIDQLGIATPVTLIGHSLGAAVALRYAVREPDKVAKLVAVSLPIQGEYIHTHLSHAKPDAIIAKVVGKSNSYMEIDSEIRKTDPKAVNLLARELSDHNFAADLVECTRPVLMVFGGQDPVIQPPSGEYRHLQRKGNNRYYVALDDCRHFPMLQQKAKFNRLILDFIHADESLTELAPKEYWQRRVR
ncbi:MAG: alpha/beta fold hydrolase [Anaerolineae bacterium]